MKLKRRNIDSEGLEIRTEQENGKPKIRGYGIVYNRETHLFGDLHEVIRPGAATDILSSNPDVRCCFNHDPDRVFGRTKSGTLALEEDENGVRYTADPPDAQWSKDIVTSIERGDIDGSSFVFGVSPENEKITKRDDGTYLIEVMKIDRLREIGPVTHPAYETTTANIRSLKEEHDSYTDYLRAQEKSVEIAERQRALELRKKRLDLKIKSIGGIADD